MTGLNLRAVAVAIVGAWRKDFSRWTDWINKNFSDTEILVVVLMLFGLLLTGVGMILSHSGIVGLGTIVAVCMVLDLVVTRFLNTLRESKKTLMNF